MQKYLITFLFLCSGVFLSACDSSSPMDQEEEKVQVSYNFDSPDSNFTLPAVLGEISGISFFNDSTLLAVNDEDGIVYFIDANTGAITKELNWGQAADYEDIEVVNGDTWVLSSDGRLFLIFLDPSGDLESITEYSTPLTSANDTEGLAYDSESNSLLIACKESPGIGYSGFSRTVYAFDLASKSMIDEAILVIDFEEINGTAPIEGYRVQDFKPSAIGIHPRTKEWFITSAVKKGVLSFLDGQLSGISNWDDDLFRKPEGIAFNENGDLFIANEADGAEPTLLRFNARYQNN